MRSSMEPGSETGREGLWNACRMVCCPHLPHFSPTIEVFYKVKKVKGTGIAIKNLEAFLTIPNMRFIDVNGAVIYKSLELIREYDLLPRDAIHAATAFIEGAKTIFSQDKDFDSIKGLNRKWDV